MPIKPPTGFATRPEASKLFNRSQRQLERDLDVAYLAEDHQVLCRYKLMTKDGELRDAKEVTTQQVKQRQSEGMIPVWYVETSYLEQEYGKNAMRDNPTNRVTEISRQLKQLASELHVPLIAVSQLSRAVENRPGNIPQLSDLRESGAIEQDAHVVLMLYREELYEEDCGNPGLTDVYIRKNRNGQTGKVQLFFEAKRTLFKNYSARTEQQSR